MAELPVHLSLEFPFHRPYAGECIGKGLVSELTRDYGLQGKVDKYILQIVLFEVLQMENISTIPVAAVVTYMCRDNVM